MGLWGRGSVVKKGRIGIHLILSSIINMKKCNLISFLKVWHYLKKNLYRANTCIKIHNVFTYLAMPLTDWLFFYLSLFLISCMKTGYF